MRSDDIRAELGNHIRSEFVNEYESGLSMRTCTRPLTTSILNNSVSALQHVSHLAATIEPPAWINEAASLPTPHSLLAMKNGILQFDKLETGTGNPLLPSTPSFFTFNAVPLDYSPAAPTPIQWLAFLKSLWPDEPDSISCLQEWFGYLLTCDTRLQKMLMIIGPKRSGKGTLVRILSKIVGSNSIVFPTLASLSTQFGLAPLIGKSVAVISDARLGNRTDQSIITERLLSISGEDSQTIDRKYRSTITCKLATRFLLASNELPRLSDTSGALSGRMIVLKLTRSFFGKEDTALEAKLSTELHGVLQWAIAGLIRLRNRGYFLQADSGRGLVQELEDLASPVGAFVREECYIEDGVRTEISELYERWKEWCESRGRHHAGSQQTFGRDLHAAVPAITVNRPVLQNKRVRMYLGIRLRHVGDPELEYPSAQSADFPFVSTAKESTKRREEENIQDTILPTADCANGADPQNKGVHEL